ncbi:hypothetical protein [Streptosporangium sp. NPDC049644]
MSSSHRRGQPAHRKQQFTERSDCWKEHGLVFPSLRGTPMEPE